MTECPDQSTEGKKMRIQKRHRGLPTAALAGLFLLAAGLCVAEEAPATAEETGPTSWVEAFKMGDWALGFRYRYETVSQDSFDKDANASTLRTTLSYGSQPYKRFNVFLEFEDVRTLGTSESYNNVGAGDLNNGVTDRPVIADPKLTDLNQGYLRFHLAKATKLDLGRREIVFDNARFVGNVAWRQNHQSYDGGMIQSKDLENFTATYTYIQNVNRINGGNQQMGSSLLNLAYKFKAGTLVGYYYLLDYKFEAQFGLDTGTFGLRFAGAKPFDSAKFRYQAEYATQSDAGDNPNEVDADYYLIQLGGDVQGFNFDAGLEVLGGELGKGSFNTPLATLHAFNGWADKFLSTPPTGLQDLFLSAGWKGKGFNAKLIYHQFDSDSESIQYGNEWDAVLSYKTRWNQTFAGKAAIYSADEFSDDTTKYWIWTAYTFK